VTFGKKTTLQFNLSGSIHNLIVQKDEADERTPPQADGVSSAKAIEYLQAFLTPQSGGVLDPS